MRPATTIRGLLRSAVVTVLPSAPRWHRWQPARSLVDPAFDAGRSRLDLKDLVDQEPIDMVLVGFPTPCDR